jgi:hypothetical protein
MTVPAILLWVFAFAYGVVSGLTREEAQLPSNAELVSSFVLPLLLTFWVTTDARIRQRSLCYDFDTFVFFGWPVLIPVYLFQTRGVRAFLTLLFFSAIWIFAWIVSVIASAIYSG